MVGICFNKIVIQNVVLIILDFRFSLLCVPSLYIVMTTKPW